MIRKKLAVGILTTIMTAGLSMTSFAGTWQQDNVGWWYQNDDSSYKANEWFQDTDGSWYRFAPSGYTMANQWQQVDGAWYYFDAAGTMLTNTTTPDGYKVGSDGAWIQSTTNAVNTGSTAGSGSGSSVTNNGVDILYAPNVDDSERIYINSDNWLSSQSSWAEGLDISEVYSAGIKQIDIDYDHRYSKAIQGR